MTLQFIRREHLTGNVWSLTFSPSQRLTWIAGQFIKIAVPHENPDEEGTKRWFTISSAPHNRLIQITTRITDSTFKKALSLLRSGDRIILLDPPAGDFVWPTSEKSLIFVAHGIGITPFVSMLEDRSHRNLPLSATLFYSSRRGATPAFQSKLEQWASSHPEFTLHQAKEPFAANALDELVTDLASSLVYVSGPLSLLELLSPPYGLASRQLKTDFFPGYTPTDY